MTRAALTLTLAALGAALAAGCQADVSAGSLDRCALGARVQPDPGETADEAVARFEATIERPLDVERLYATIDDDVPGARERTILLAGRVPLVSITGELDGGGRLAWARVADPTDVEADAKVRALAARLAAFDGPVRVIFHDEAQGDDAFGTAAEFVAAWRHVVEVARAAGASQVEWVWALGSGAFPTEADAWYPGDDVVDWIGTSGFNWYTGDPVSPWRTFPSIFGPFHEWATPHAKPLALVSVSTAENPGQAADAPRSKATWIAEAEATLRAWPEVQTFVWYDGDGPDATRDWHVDSSPAALDAYRALAADPHFDVSGATPDRAP